MKSRYDEYIIDQPELLEYIQDRDMVDRIRANTLSDEEWKEFRNEPPHRVVRAFLRSGNIEPHELRLISSLLETSGQPYSYPVEHAANWGEPVLDGYIEHIRNFAYNYKPEATAIDPDIDPNEEHIGPMAQDIEKVNPACVNTDENGVKTVDTARLALMNAGAIAELARKIEGMK